MNYKESQEILNEIQKSKRILVNLHRGPDPDSYACAFGLYYFLCSLHKEVDVVLTKNSEFSSQLSRIEDADKVKFVDYAKFDFSKYDLFITPDSGSWQQIVDDEKVKLPEIPIIVIDHHASNDKFGKINLVDAKAVSCAQVVYLLFRDWDFFIDSKMANLLMLGLTSDSGGFAFGNDATSMKVGGELIDLGADKEEIIKQMFRTQTFNQVKAWGDFLARLQFNREHKFVWTAVSYEEYIKLKIPPKASSMVATQFISIIDGTDFGIVMNEDEKNVLKLSFRSRNSGFDVAKLAEQLGGGGHKKAAGGQIEGMPFNKAVERVLETAKRFATENK